WPHTRAIRTYSSTLGGEQVPPIAGEFGLRVTLGAWLDDNKKRNQRELRSVIELTRRSGNVNGVVVGNEVVYRGNTVLVGDESLSGEEQQGIDAARAPGDQKRVKEDINVAHLVRVIQRVKRETDGRVPVTTGEIWSVWRDHPELVSAVDFIAVHILPYWEGV